MDIGLLWYEAQKDKPMTERVRAAAAAALRRRLGPVDTCYVHPTELPDGDLMIEGVQVRSSARVLRGHLWIGQESRPAVVSNRTAEQDALNETLSLAPGFGQLSLLSL